MTELTADVLLSSPAEVRWPAEAEFILSALEAARPVPLDRRSGGRVAYRARGLLRLFSDLEGAPPWTLYTRDVSPRGLGFITPQRPPLGHGGRIELPCPRGRMLRIDCTLLRCRPTVNGWFEGAMYFNREQNVFRELIAQT